MEPFATELDQTFEEWGKLSEAERRSFIELTSYYVELPNRQQARLVEKARVMIMFKNRTFITLVIIVLGGSLVFALSQSWIATLIALGIGIVLGAVIKIIE
jgi:hypothetical protein